MFIAKASDMRKLTEQAKAANSSEGDVVYMLVREAALHGKTQLVTEAVSYQTRITLEQAGYTVDTVEKTVLLASTGDEEKLHLSIINWA